MILLADRLRASNKPGVSEKYWRLRATATSWSSSYPYSFSAFEIQFFESANASGTNSNLGATATASSFYDTTYEASKANDNVGTSRWASVISPGSLQWWAVQYAAPKRIASVSCGLYGTASSAIHPKTMVLEASNNGSNWVVVATLTTNNTQTTQTWTNLQ